MPLASPILCTPLDGPLGTVTAARPLGSATLAVSDPGLLGTPTPSAPVRLTVVAADLSAILARFKVTGLSGAAATVVPDGPDAVIPAGSLLMTLIDGRMIGDIHGAIGDVVAGVNALPGAGVTAVNGQSGAVSLTAANLPGLAAVATTGAYGSLSGRPTLAAVATSGNYADLAGRPSLGSLATQSGTFSGTSSGTNTGDQTIALTGDVAGSGTGMFAATLATTGVAAGAYSNPSILVDAKGRITSATSGLRVSPGGSDGSIQFNQTGSFAGSRLSAGMTGYVLQATDRDGYPMLWLSDTGNLSLGDEYDSDARFSLNGSDTVAPRTVGIRLYNLELAPPSNDDVRFISIEQCKVDASAGPVDSVCGISVSPINTQNGTSVSSAYGARISSPSFGTVNYGVVVYATIPTGVGLAVEGTSNQVGDLAQFQLGGGAVASGVDASGYIRSVVGSGPPTSTPVDGSMYLDNTNAAFYVRTQGVWKKVALS